MIQQFQLTSSDKLIRTLSRLGDKEECYPSACAQMTATAPWIFRCAAQI
ncbi:unnamed protein product, partial [Mesorhabditis belari]|uniref:Uncharacterized protein n=1 Tax=Mesorhabditis belari TaxID=2138241 RepID=A0AAF3ER54_9BILA